MHRQVFHPAQDSSVQLGLTSREKLMSPEYIYICIYIDIDIDIYVYVYTSANESLKDEKHLLLLCVGSLVTLYTFVFTHITTVVEPVHIFMLKRTLFSSLCAYIYIYIYIFHFIIHFQFIIYIIDIDLLKFCVVKW